MSGEKLPSLEAGEKTGRRVGGLVCKTSMSTGLLLVERKNFPWVAAAEKLRESFHEKATDDVYHWWNLTKTWWKVSKVR